MGAGRERSDPSTAMPPSPHLLPRQLRHLLPQAAGQAMSSALYHPEQLDADLHEAWVDRRNAHDALKAKDTPANRAAWRETRDRMDFLLDLLSEG